MRRVHPMIGLVVAGLLAGCGGESNTGPVPPAPPPLPVFGSVTELSKAVDAQQRADKTVRMAVTGTVDGGTPVDGIGAWKFDDPAGPSASFSEQAPRAGADPVDVTLVVLPATAYVKPADPTMLPPGKSWVEVGPTTRDPFYRQFISVAQWLRDYTNASENLTRPGLTITSATPEKLGTERAVHYKLGIGVAPFEMSLDSNNRVLTTEIGQSGNGTPGADAAGSATTPGLDVHYQDWGKQVVVVHPPPPLIAQR
jgi:hypothetical protein